MSLLPVRDKRLAAALTGLLLAAVVAPVANNRREHPADSFPFSYYPMFTAKRSELLRVTHLVGVTASGEQLLLPGSLTGAGGLNQVRKQITAAVNRGDGERLCRVVAARVARSPSAQYAGVDSVSVVTGRYRLYGWLWGDTEPVSTKVHASVPVPRQRPQTPHLEEIS